MSPAPRVFTAQGPSGTRVADWVGMTALALACRPISGPRSGGHDLLVGSGGRRRGNRVLVLRSDQPALHDLVEERLVADLQQPGRLRPVPVHAVEHFLDGDALGVPRGLASDVLQADDAL